jgi:hypothetical protein
MPALAVLTAKSWSPLLTEGGIAGVVPVVLFPESIFALLESFASFVLSLELPQLKQKTTRDPITVNFARFFINGCFSVGNF